MEMEWRTFTLPSFTEGVSCTETKVRSGLYAGFFDISIKLLSSSILILVRHFVIVKSRSKSRARFLRHASVVLEEIFSPSIRRTWTLLCH